MDFKRAIEDLRTSSKDIMSKTDKYSDSIDKAMSAIDMVGEMLAMMKNGDEAGLELKLAELDDINDTLKAIMVMDEEIQKSKEQELEVLKNIIHTTNKIVGVAITLAGLAV